MSKVIVLFVITLAVISVRTMHEENKCEGDHCHSGSSEKCSLTPMSSEGPFFLDDQPVRVDITEGKPGVPLEVHLTVKDVKNCEPVKGMKVHLWHSDAFGYYSAYSGYYPLGSPMSQQVSGGHAEPTEEATFLRGIQETDENGKVMFQTIYPGWYKFRTLHIHLKITKDGKSYYTGEIYFTDKLTDAVATEDPYKTRTDEARVRNTDDWQFVEDGGRIMIMHPTGDVKTKLEGSLDIIINMDAYNKT